RFAPKIRLERNSGKAFCRTQSVGVRELAFIQCSELAPGKGAVIDDDTGNKALFLTIAIGHGVFYLVSASRTVQKINAVTKVSEQRQFETTQHRLRGAGCASKCL